MYEHTPDSLRTTSGCACGNTAGFLLHNSSYSEYVFDSGHGSQTIVDAVNNNGILAGSYLPASTKLAVGFISNGTTISYKDKNTTLTAINNKGLIVGNNGAVSFEANESGKILETFKFPDATETTAYGINDLGVVVGYFLDSSSHYHGCVLQKGTYTQVDAPEATDTRLYGINASGEVAGIYYTANNIEWGVIGKP